MIMSLNVLNEFKKLCAHQPTECGTACRVYVDLLLDKNYDRVSKCYDSSLNIIYIKAESCDNNLIIFPSLITQDLDLNIIHKLQNDHNGSKFLLALCDTSSNILYYQKLPD